MPTKIEYVDEALNPIVGCSKVSDGCQNCYAEKMAARLARMEKTKAMYGPVITCGRWNGKTNVDLSVMNKAEKWKNPKRIFVGTMTDVFHETVDTLDMISLFGRMAHLDHHTFILVIKRPEGVMRFCREAGMAGGDARSKRKRKGKSR